MTDTLEAPTEAPDGWDYSVENHEPVGDTEPMELILREALDRNVANLARYRAKRDAINGDIRNLVAENEVLTQALRPFERAARRDASPEGASDAAP